MSLTYQTTQYQNYYGPGLHYNKTFTSDIKKENTEMKNKVDESWAKFFTHKGWKYKYTVVNKDALLVLSNLSDNGLLTEYLLPELVSICREYLAIGTYFTIYLPRRKNFIVTFPTRHSVEYYVPPGLGLFILNQACSKNLEMCEEYFIGEFKYSVADSIQYGFHIGPCARCEMSFLVETESKSLRCCSCGENPISRSLY